MFDIQEELKKLPAKPGVYLMHNAQDEIIYVGKARILKNRVRQYFQSSYNKSVKIQHMVSHIAYFEYIITDSELEALVLECNLIKEHRPHYNTMLKDAPGCSAYVIGDHGLYNALYDAGITINDVDPDYIVVGETVTYGYEHIITAMNLVNKGARLIATNTDITGPIEGGIAPACRAFVAPIEATTGKKAYYVGKPNPLMMRTGLQILGVHSSEAVMIGDRMDTDIIAGIETGLDTALVLSGVSTRETVKEFPYRPRLILNGVGDIAE